MCAHLLGENSNRSQWGMELGSIRIIATDHTHIFRNPQSEIPQGLVDSVSALVIACKDCSCRLSSGEYGFGSEIADILLSIGIEPGQVARQSSFFHSLSVSFIQPGKPGEF